MGYVKNEDIMAYRIDGQIVCTDCITDEEENNLEEADIICQDEIDSADGKFFCDRHNGRI